VIGGAVTALLFAFVLRFDLRAVPALVALYAATEGAVDALSKGSFQTWTLYAIGAALTLAISWLATRYLVAQGEIREAPSPHAAAPGSEALATARSAPSPSSE